jgi:hypothetical protein
VGCARGVCLGASAWACTALQGGPGLVKAAAAVQLGDPLLPLLAGVAGGRQGGRAVTPLVYVTIFGRSPGGGWFLKTEKPGLAVTKTGRNLAGKEAPYREKEDTICGFCSL